MSSDSNNSRSGWQMYPGTIPKHGKVHVVTQVDKINGKLCWGLSSRKARIDGQSVGDYPSACYYVVFTGGGHAALCADGTLVQDNIPRECRAGSTIELIMDHDASSTMEFRLDDVSVGKLTVKPEHKEDLTLAACVELPGTALTLVSYKNGRKRLFDSTAVVAQAQSDREHENKKRRLKKMIQNAKLNPSRTPLFLAARWGDIGTASALLEAKAPVDDGGVDGASPLHVATEHGHLRLTNMLIQAGANVNRQTFDGLTSLHQVMWNGKDTVVGALLTAGADPNLVSDNGYAPIHFAAQRGYVTVVQMLIEASAQVNCVTANQWTPLHCAARNGHIDVVQLLVDSGANVNVATRTGYTPLHLACFHGHLAVVQILLGRGANIDHATKNSVTAMQFAAENGHTEVVKLLIKKGGNPAV